VSRPVIGGLSAAKEFSEDVTYGHAATVAPHLHPSKTRNIGRDITPPAYRGHMLDLGFAQYPLCLLDTNAVSAMVKDEEFRSNFYTWAQSNEPQFVPCFTIYTIFELRKVPGLFQRFVELFQILPCVLIKGYFTLFEDEIASYPDPPSEDPCAIAFSLLGGEGQQLSNLPQLLDLSIEQEREWNRTQSEIVEGMLSLVENFPPSGDKYTSEETRLFVWMASLGLIHGHDEAFATDKDNAEEEIRCDAFRAFKAMSYTVFYKFYADRTRAPRVSDGYDVLISSALPYVEAFVTERNQAEVLRQTKRRDDFLNALQLFVLSDFRDQAPVSFDD
jgi:hypothetical protein